MRQFKAEWKNVINLYKQSEKNKSPLIKEIFLNFIRYNETTKEWRVILYMYTHTVSTNQN